MRLHWWKRGLHFLRSSLRTALFLAAVGIQRRFQVSYWDAAIIAAAGQMGCTALYSEDLNHGQSYDGVTVINPFMETTS